MEGNLTAASSYLAHLPAILRQGSLMGRFLLAFEAVLSGRVSAPEGYTDPLPVGLEDALDSINRLLVPEETPEEFLPWLAQWVARSINEDWSFDTTRKMISQAVSLYHKRGTAEGLQEVLNICCTGSATAEIIEVENDARPHYFEVTLLISEQDPDLLASKARLVRAIIDQEKPAHTYYGLSIKYPGLRISNDPSLEDGYGPGVIVGVNTVIGTQTLP